MKHHKCPKTPIEPSEPDFPDTEVACIPLDSPPEVNPYNHSGRNRSKKAKKRTLEISNI